MDKDKEEEMKCISMDEGSETGSKSVVVVSNPGSIHAFLIVNTEAWDRVMKSFKDVGKALDAGIQVVKPQMEEAARRQSEVLQQFKRECLGEWIRPEGQVFTIESLRAWQADILEKQHIARIKQEEERARQRAILDDSLVRDIFKDTAFSFSIQSEPIKTLKELLDEVQDEGLFPELQAKIDLARQEQTQLHKKKGKKVKNWEHNKFWHGRK